MNSKAVMIALFMGLVFMSSALVPTMAQDQSTEVPASTEQPAAGSRSEFLDRIFNVSTKLICVPCGPHPIGYWPSHIDIFT